MYKNQRINILIYVTITICKTKPNKRLLCYQFAVSKKTQRKSLVSLFDFASSFPGTNTN